MMIELHHTSGDTAHPNPSSDKLRDCKVATKCRAIASNPNAQAYQRRLFALICTLHQLPLVARREGGLLLPIPDRHLRHQLQADHLFAGGLLRQMRQVDPILADVVHDILGTG
jgi:hypothetical protein